MTISTEITADARAFTAAVQWVAKWVTARPVVPIQGGITLTVASGCLSIGAYSENATARAAVEITGPAPADASPQRAIVSGRLLAELVGAIDKRDVTIGSDASGAVVLTSGRFVATLPTMPEDDYPTLPVALAEIGTVSGAALAVAVTRAVIASGRDMEPAWLNTAWCRFGDGEITVMSTDRYRIGRTVLPWKSTGTAVVTPTAAMLADACSAFAGAEQVTIGTDGYMLSLTGPDRSLTLATIDTRNDKGEIAWPTEMLMPQIDTTHPNSVLLHRDALAMPLKRARIMSGKGGNGHPNPVRLHLAPGSLTITAAQADDGRSSADPLTVDYQGPDYLAAFNPDYLADALKTAPTDTVLFAFNDPRRHAIVTSPDDPSWRHVLMPVRILS